MNPSQKKRWERQRMKGKKRFVLRSTIWYGLTGIIIGLITGLPKSEFSLSDIAVYEMMMEILKPVFFFIVFGYFFSHYVWKSNEKKYLGK